MISAPLQASPTLTGWRRILTAERVALFLVILAAALPYLSSLTFGFVYDDLGVIVEVPSRHTWLGVAQAWVQSYWGNPETGLYRPVAQFMYALLWNVGGGKPWIFHLYADRDSRRDHARAVVAARARDEQAGRRSSGRSCSRWIPCTWRRWRTSSTRAKCWSRSSASRASAIVLRAFVRVDGAEIRSDGSRRCSRRRAYALAIGAKESGAGIPAIAFLCRVGLARHRTREGARDSATCCARAGACGRSAPSRWWEW